MENNLNKNSEDALLRWRKINRLIKNRKKWIGFTADLTNTLPDMRLNQPNGLKLPFHVIKDCTQDFNNKNFIGKGGYGSVYKGILTWGDHIHQLVAVKRLDVNGFQGNKEFRTEVAMLSEYQHKNIIKLIGFCDDNKEMILVYEYASHGSLDKYLSDTTMSGGLSWSQLHKICIGVASALDYLHNQVAEKHRIIHRDVKSANVLLDENWNAKLSDFGLARIGLANQQNTFVITNPAGTYGYTDPQYERTGFLTKESDVYSFGVVLFEVLCGRLACVSSYHDERRFLHHLARTCYKNGELDKIIDQRIKKDINSGTLSMFSAIAYQCLQETREERPTIAEVAFQLKEAYKIKFTQVFKIRR
ncbi:unnamed protein product [Lactuca saligna]|uniref:Protein kinase domain-containing protein n=1 Tax=Lactuca saligna TaxID=75948 RepID=A0AA36DZF4_LACSI|nr:unnamed protein product [Lactuca saligna]